VIMLITVGVMIASLKEASFSWHGLIFGMLASIFRRKRERVENKGEIGKRRYVLPRHLSFIHRDIGFSGRNTLSKWVMLNHDISKERVFVYASFVSCVPCILPVLFYELPILLTIPRSVYLSIFYTSVMYFLYNTVSFTVLEGVSPVTHAIANCCKRLFIVVVSILVFRTVIQPLNIVGSLIAIFGVALYSQLGSGQTLGKVLRKNILLIFLGSLLVGGVLLVPKDASVINTNESESYDPLVGNDNAFFPMDCPPPVYESFIPEKRGNSELVKHLQGEIVRLLKPHFKNYKKVVMLDVPDHNNKGDSAIFTGEDQFLRLINVEIIHACSDAGRFWCNTTKIKQFAKPTETLICLHGGGNFGDLWQWVVDARNKFVASLVDSGYDFLMFPQTVTFRDKNKIKPVQELYGRIKNLVFTVRDIPSMKFMERYFPNVTTVYMPDMAWMNGHKEIVKKPPYELLFFLRRDHEGDQKIANRVREKMNELVPEMKYKIDDWTSFDVPWKNAIEEMNYDRFYSGLDFLTQAKVVVMNRLHGHILSVLLDLPHVIVDNIYGKVFDNHKAWTLNATGVEMAGDIDVAIDKALVLLAEWYPPTEIGN